MDSYYGLSVVCQREPDGCTNLGICDAMFESRELTCMGPISPEMVSMLIMQVRLLESADPDEEITLLINSPGGDLTSGLALYDVLRAVSCPIRTVCVGTAASMAALIFMSGDKREMLEHASAMIHDPLIAKGIRGSISVLDDAMRNLKDKRDLVARIIARHTGQSMEDVLAATARGALRCPGGSCLEPRRSYRVPAVTCIMPRAGRRNRALTSASP